MKTLKLLFIALLAGILTLGVAGTAFAAVPASMDDCPHAATVESLHQCVTHAEMMGHITSPAIAARLQSFLNQADLALVRGQKGVAANWLRRFIRLVENSAAHGLIDPVAAQHLVEHAHLVQHALLTPAR